MKAIRGISKFGYFMTTMDLVLCGFGAGLMMYLGMWAGALGWTVAVMYIFNYLITEEIKR